MRDTPELKAWQAGTWKSSLTDLLHKHVYSRHPLKAYPRKGILPQKAYLFVSPDLVRRDFGRKRHTSLIRHKAYPQGGKRHTFGWLFHRCTISNYSDLAFHVYKLVSWMKICSYWLCLLLKYVKTRRLMVVTMSMKSVEPMPRRSPGDICHIKQC